MRWRLQHLRRFFPRSRTKKSTTDNLSSYGDRFCWVNTSGADHAAGLLKIAVNDPAGIYFVAMTVQFQSYGKTGLTNDGGVSQVRVNDNLSHGFKNLLGEKNTKRVEEIFHNLSEKMRVSLVKMCI